MIHKRKMILFLCVVFSCESCTIHGMYSESLFRLVASCVLGTVYVGWTYIRKQHRPIEKEIIYQAGGACHADKKILLGDRIITSIELHGESTVYLFDAYTLKVNNSGRWTSNRDDSPLVHVNWTKQEEQYFVIEHPADIIISFGNGRLVISHSSLVNRKKFTGDFYIWMDSVKKIKLYDDAKVVDKQNLNYLDYLLEDGCFTQDFVMRNLKIKAQDNSNYDMGYYHSPVKRIRMNVLRLIAKDNARVEYNCQDVIKDQKPNEIRYYIYNKAIAAINVTCNKLYVHAQDRSTIKWYNLPNDGQEWPHHRWNNYLFNVNLNDNVCFECKAYESAHNYIQQFKDNFPSDNVYFNKSHLYIADGVEQRACYFE